MAYCTQSDIEELLPSEQLVQLTDDDEDGVADASVVAQAIAHADGVIDSYCQERYDVPFSTVPEIIKGISVDIAIWYCYTRRDIAMETREKRHDNAMKMLAAIRDGKISLGADPIVSETGQTIQSTTEDRDRVFTDTDEGTMADF